MSMTYDELKVINEGKLYKDQQDWIVEIDGEALSFTSEYQYISEITVKLENLVQGSNTGAEVTLSEISYCGKREDWESQNASLL